MSASVINDQSVVIWKRSAIPSLPILQNPYTTGAGGGSGETAEGSPKGEMSGGERIN